MNPRQRRGMLLLLATAVGAVVVFVMVTLFVQDVRSEVGPYEETLQFKVDVDELEQITMEMVETVEVPARWISDVVVVDPEQVLGKVSSGRYSAGATIQEGMIEDPPGLKTGFREVAIIVDAETGVAGKVRPGDRVDILATTQGTETTPARAEVWVENALVLEVGLPQQIEEEDASGRFSDGAGVPVTFALPVDESLKLAYAESFSTKLRLALRGRGDEAGIPDAVKLFE